MTFPSVDEMEAAGFTVEQILVLQAIVARLQGQILGNIAALNNTIDRLKPEVWL